MEKPFTTVEYREGSDEATFVELMRLAGHLDDSPGSAISAMLLRDFLVRVPICMKPLDRHLEAAVTGYGQYAFNRKPLLDTLFKLYGPVRASVTHSDGRPNNQASGNVVLGFTPPFGKLSAHELLKADAKIRHALSAMCVAARTAAAEIITTSCRPTASSRTTGCIPGRWTW